MEEKSEVLTMLISEALRDTLQWIVAHGTVDDFYMVLAPCLVQIGIDAPSSLTGGERIGELAMQLAVNGQRQFMGRMGVAQTKKEAARKRIAEWRAAHANSNADSNVTVTEQKQNSNADSNVTVGEVRLGEVLPNQSSPNQSSPNQSPPEKGGVGEKEKAQSNPDFELFWEAYGKKVGRNAAESAFAKAKKSKDWLGIDTLLAVVAIWRKSEQWTKDGGQYQPHAATWLKQHRWTDEAPHEATPQKGMPPGYIYHQEDKDAVREDF